MITSLTVIICHWNPQKLIETLILHVAKCWVIIVLQFQCHFGRSSIIIEIYWHEQFSIIGLKLMFLITAWQLVYRISQKRGWTKLQFIMGIQCKQLVFNSSITWYLKKSWSCPKKVPFDPLWWTLRWLPTEYSENLLFWSFKHFFLNHLNQILTIIIFRFFSLYS